MAEKTEILPIRFDPESLKWIEQKAEKAGVSKGRYIRKVVLGELPQADIPFDKKDRQLNFKNGITHREMKKVLYEKFPKWGNNYNQIARKLNSGNPIDQKMLKMAKDIDEKIKEMATVIFQGLG